MSMRHRRSNNPPKAPPTKSASTLSAAGTLAAGSAPSQSQSRSTMRAVSTDALSVGSLTRWDRMSGKNVASPAASLVGRRLMHGDSGNFPTT